jgi:hypothetical protein
MSRVYGVIAVVGLFLILGAAGASDLGNASPLSAALQASIGLILFTGSVIASGGWHED